MSQDSSNLIQVQNGEKRFGGRALFEQVTFAINENEHVGVIGPNGAGKTTLFKILIGDEELSDGRIVRAQKLRLGYLSQHDSWPPTQTAEQYLMATVEDQSSMWELEMLGKKLGLATELFERPMLSLSGGYRMRFKLLGLLGQRPNLMLLDEPTNYLDLETTLVLERFLQGYEGTFLLISHDREFLRRTTDHILEVEQGAVTKFSGGLDDYFEQKEMLRGQLEARSQSIAEKRQSVLDFVARFGAKATKAKQAQSRLKSLSRLEQIEIKPLPIQARIRIPAPARSGRVTLRISDGVAGYDSRPIVSQINFSFVAGDHVAIVGLNGAGKSTLLKTLADRLPLISGIKELGHEVTVSFFAQHVVDDLNLDHTVIESLQEAAHPSVLPQEVLDLAGSLLFSGDEVRKELSVLSGGERTRVALGRVMLKKANCLILDEPTNHLDFNTVEALTEALSSFPGTVIVVSHDRSFVGRVGKKILEVRDGRAWVYPGTYDEYVWALEKSQVDEEKATKTDVVRVESSREPENNSGSTHKDKRERKKLIEKQLKQAETVITRAEIEMPKLEVEIERLSSQLAGHVNVGSTSEIIDQITQLQKKLETWEKDWTEAFDRKDQLSTELLTFQKNE